MFGNQQDTCLLHNSFLSAVKRIQSEEINKKRGFDLEDENEAIAIVSSTVTGLTQGIIRTSPVDEILVKQLHLQRRCHAAIFFTVLKSNGINCAEASKYYESIAHIFPTLSWKFYLKLNYHCKWSEYFVECSQELEPDILSIVLKKILYIEWNEEYLKYYSWHIVLQAIIWKFFLMEDSTLSSLKDSCTFAFPFVSSDLETVASNSILDKDKDSFAKSQLLHSFVTLLNNLNCSLTSSLGCFDFIKIIFHAYKTIFCLLLKVSTCKKNIVKELFRLNKLIQICCSEKQSLDVIEGTLQRKDEKIPLSHYYAMTSWEINGNYLMFILCNYWYDLKLLSKESSDCASLEESLPPSSEIELLRNYCPFFKNKFEKEDSNYILSLEVIISLNYPCSTRAAVILLLHPEIRESDEVLIILESKFKKLNALEIYPVLACAVATSQCENAKKRLLNLFFQILSESSIEFYNLALEYILNHYGVNSQFCLHDFDDQLNYFIRKLMSDDEAQKCLLPLFVQSPRDVLKMLIEQALLQGSNESWVKVLKLIPIACLHSDALIEELKPYFERKDIGIKEMNNMTGLIESLMKIHVETCILDFDKFLQEIIMPTLAAEKKVFFTLECLNISLNVLILKNILKIKTEALSLLIKCLSSIINKCIKVGDGRIKELAVTTFSLLNKTDGIKDLLKMEFYDELSSYSSSVRVYISKLFGEIPFNDFKCAEFKLDDSWWIWSCNFKDRNAFQETILEKISYEKLVSVLITVLPHLTREEWFESANLIGEYVRNLNLDGLSSVPWLLPKSDPQLYAVIRCLMDSYYFTLKKGLYDLNYVSNCFTSTVERILSEEINLHLHLNVFLDVCHLTLDNTDEVYTNLLPFLLTVKKSIEDECKDKHLKTVYLKFLHSGIKSLPNSEEKLPFFTSCSEKSLM